MNLQYNIQEEPEVEKEEEELLIKHKEITCLDYVYYSSYELLSIFVCIALGCVWVLMCLRILIVYETLRVLHSNRYVTIPVFLILDVFVIVLLGVHIVRKWGKLKNQITMVGDVEIISQPSKKRLEIKRNKKKIGSPDSSSSYFSINELPVGHLCPGLYNITKQINQPDRTPIPFLKWKQGLEADYLLKVTLIGDPGTGKTMFREAVSGNPFSKYYHRTFGVDFCALYWEYQDGDRHSRFHITLWDTDGHYDTNSAHFRVSGKSANCVALVYDITKPESLYSLKTYYNQIITLSLGKEWPYPPKFVVLANKIDIDKDWKKEEDEKWVNKNLHRHVPFVPVSCATRYGIASAAERIVLTACGLIDYESDTD